MRTTLILCLSVLSFSAQSAPLVDQASLDQAETLFFEGLAHFRSSRFEAAAVEFQKAYVLTQHSDLIYNIARSRERLGDRAGAVAWYRAYLGTTPPDETAVIHRIRQLGGEPTPSAKVLATLPKAGETKRAPTQIVEEGGGLLPWAVLGAGVIAAGAGTFLGFNALDDAAAARDEIHRGTAEDFRASAESNALYADIAFGVGAVMAGTAVALWWAADSAAHSQGRVEVGVTPRSVSLGWHF